LQLSFSSLSCPESPRSLVFRKRGNQPVQKIRERDGIERCTAPDPRACDAGALDQVNLALSLCAHRSVHAFHSLMGDLILR
jgi:hypothetical protein